jgi:ribonuclease-3
MPDAGRLQRSLGYQFQDSGLLTLALTHRSAGGQNNERLEFLGDSILNHIIAESLYARFPQAREGDLSRMRASLVKGATLAELARELDLGDYLVLGSGERKSGGHRRGSILADALEAVIGAILLDADVETCRERVLEWFDPRLTRLADKAVEKDPKTRLQEYLQGRGLSLPEYRLLNVQGEAHSQVFTVACLLGTPQTSVEGSGSSRRRAEQAAAQGALERLENHGKK